MLHNLRDYSNDKHKRVDDYAFSGDAGMVMMVEPIFNAINHLKSQRTYDEVIYTSPDGKMLKPTSDPITYPRLPTSSSFADITKASTSACATTWLHLKYRWAIMCLAVESWLPPSLPIVWCDWFQELWAMKLLPLPIPSRTNLLAPPVYTRPGRIQWLGSAWYPAKWQWTPWLKNGNLSNRWSEPNVSVLNCSMNGARNNNNNHNYEKQLLFPKFCSIINSPF